MCEVSLWYETGRRHKPSPGGSQARALPRILGRLSQGWPLLWNLCKIKYAWWTPEKQEQSEGHFICKLFITENIKSVKYTSLWLGHKLSDYQIFFMRLCDTDLTWQHQGLWKQCAAVLSQISSSSRSAKRNKSTCEFTTTLSSDSFAAPAVLSAVLLCLIYLYSCSIHSVPVVYTDSWRPAGWVVVPVILLWSHLECLCSWCTGV